MAVLRAFAAVAVLTAVRFVGALKLHDKLAIGTPDIVIFGVGDSGTRGVKEALEHLGVTFCHIDMNSAGDTRWDTMRYIPTLLKDSSGHVSEANGYKSSSIWNQTNHDVLSKSQQIWKCAIDDKGLNSDSLPPDFRWGWKNPKWIYLMPHLDHVFQQKQHMLAVARDPRDICTGENDEQFLRLGELVEAPGVSRKSSKHGGSHASLHSDPHKRSQDQWYRANIHKEASAHKEQEIQKECMTFWSNLWTSVLKEYAHRDNFLIVRIEDLVVHDPNASTKSRKTIKCMSKYAGLSPGTDELHKELEAFHVHKDDYMGRHNNMTKKARMALEDDIASYTAGTEHDVMRALGYDVKHYGLTEPGHPRVFSPGRAHMCGGA